MFFNTSMHWVFKIFLTFALQSTTHTKWHMQVNVLIYTFIASQLVMFLPSFVYSVRDRRLTVLFLVETSLFISLSLMTYTMAPFSLELKQTLMFFLLTHLYVCQWKALHMSGVLLNNHTFCYYLAIVSSVVLPTFACFCFHHKSVDAMYLLYALFGGELVGLITWAFSCLVVSLSNGIEGILS